MNSLRDLLTLSCYCACLLPVCYAFLPNHIGSPPYLNDEDYTLSDITEIGILLSVAKYFEDTPLDGRPAISPGDLTNLDPLTPSTLYDAYYGGGVSSAKFELAIEQIISANIEVSRLQAGVAEWHFNAEQITQANKRMIRLRNNIFSILNSSSPNYDTARTYTGQFLHMYQSFYSNTDWVELIVWLNYIALMPDAPLFPYTDLGIQGKPYFPVAPPDQNTCRNCVYSPGRPEGDCAYNIWDARMGVYLTSGFRDDQDITKPETNDGYDYFGKCSHGGPNDDSKQQTASGGINKEGTDPVLAPHYYHHVEAAELAILSTNLYFMSPEHGLLNNSGEEAFRKLLNLGTGATLAFVIDVSGSMRDEILAVQEEAIEIIRSTNGTYDAPYNYVVVPFNDPVVGPHLVTENPQECIDFIGSLNPYGGGDCPELANSGLEIALVNSLPGSQIYVFTDASDKDQYKAGDVAALAQERQCRVDYILTGDCTLASENANDVDSYPHQRRRRDAIGIRVSDSYSSISEKSGGAVYETEKENIGEVTEIIKIGLGSSKVALAKWAGYGSGCCGTPGYNETSIEVDVDTTISEFSITMTGDQAPPNITLIHPTGEPVSENDTNVNEVVNVNFVLAITVSDPEEGPWTILLNDRQYYTIDVSGQSVVDFSYQFLETDDTGVTYPAVGSPVAGVATFVSINIVGVEQIGSADVITIVARDGQDILSYELTQASERDDDLFVATVIPPTNPFSFRLDGTDLEGNSLSRLLTTQIQAQSFKLDFLPSSPDELIPGGSKVIKFSLRNEGVNDTFIISATTDTPREVQAIITPSLAYLIKGETVKGNITLTATESTTAGTISVTTLSASSSSGATTSLVTSQAVVVPDTEVLDIIRPECFIAETADACTSEMMTAETCELYRWSIVFEATEEGSGIYAIDIFPRANTTDYELDQFTQYFANGSYEGDCCCPLVTINIQDFYGNIGQCIVDYYASIANTTAPPPCLPQPPPRETTSTLKPTTTNIPLLTTLRAVPKPVDNGASTGLIVGLSVGGALLLIVVILTLLYLTNRKSPKTNVVEVNGNENPTYDVDIAVDGEEPEYGNIPKSAAYVTS